MSECTLVRGDHKILHTLPYFAIAFQRIIRADTAVPGLGVIMAFSEQATKGDPLMTTLEIGEALRGAATGGGGAELPMGESKPLYLQCNAIYDDHAMYHQAAHDP